MQTSDIKNKNTLPKQVKRLWVAAFIGIIVIPYGALAVVTATANTAQTATSAMLWVSMGACLFALLTSLYTTYASFRLGHRPSKVVSSFLVIIIFLVGSSTTLDAIISMKK